MEALSAAASILAVIGAAEKVTKGLQLPQDLKDAEQDVQACCNEISALRVVCSQIDYIRHELSKKPEPQKYVRSIRSAITW